MKKGKTIYFTKKQVELLQWIIPMYKNLHEDDWKDGVLSEEEKEVNKIIDKIDKGA